MPGAAARSLVHCRICCREGTSGLRAEDGRTADLSEYWKTSSRSFRLGLYPSHETLAAPKLNRKVSDQLFGPIDCGAILVAGARFTVAEMSVVPDSIGSVVCHCLTSVATIPATIPIR